MKILVILVSMLVVLFVAAPSEVAAQKKKTTKTRQATPRSANTRNFAKAISEYLLVWGDSDDFCIGNKTYPHRMRSFGSEDLVTAGLTKITTIDNTGFPIETFDLTSEGRDAFSSGKGFCFGKPELSRIVSSSRRSSREYRVKYSFRLKDVPGWTSEVIRYHAEHKTGLHPFYFKLDKNYRGSMRRFRLNARFQGTARLVRTENGWTHADLAP